MSKFFDNRNEADRALCKKIEELCEFEEDEMDRFPHKYYNYLRVIDKLCPYWEKFHDLSWLFTEDLLLYAMMYRNVNLVDRNINIFEQKFFVDSKEQIIGFKNKIFESNTKSHKTEVLQLYYRYGPFFEKLCHKLLGKEFRRVYRSTTTWSWIKDVYHLDNLINGKLDHIFSINDFTEQECLTIIEHKSDLLSSTFQPEEWKKRLLSHYIRLKDRSEIIVSEYDYKVWWEAHKNGIIRSRQSYIVCNFIKTITPILELEEEKEWKKQEEEERKRREAEEKRLEQYRFNMRNKHWRDDNISFRKADHLYIVDGTPLDSVTTFVKNCFPEFDSEFYANTT